MGQTILNELDTLSDIKTKREWVSNIWTSENVPFCCPGAWYSVKTWYTVLAPVATSTWFNTFDKKTLSVVSQSSQWYTVHGIKDMTHDNRFLVELFWLAKGSKDVYLSCFNSV